MVDIFSELFSSLSQLSDSAPLAPYGLRLTYSLWTLMLIWGGLFVAVSHKPFNEWIADMVKLTVIAGIPIAAIQDNAEWIRTSAVLFNNIAIAVGGEANAQAALGRMMHMAWSVMQVGGDGDRGALQSIMAAISDDGYMLSLIYRLVTSLVILLSAMVYVGVILLADVLLTIAVVFAPVLLPWWVFAPMSSLAQSCLMFFFRAGFTKAIAALILAMTSGFLEKIQATVTEASGDVSVSFTAFSGAALVCLLLAFIMGQAPSIAGALIGGFTGITMPTGGASASAGRMVNAAGSRAASAAQPATPRPGAK